MSLVSVFIGLLFPAGPGQSLSVRLERVLADVEDDGTVTADSLGVLRGILYELTGAVHSNTTLTTDQQQQIIEELRQLIDQIYGSPADPEVQPEN